VREAAKKKPKVLTVEGQRLLQRLVDEGLEKTAVALLGSAHDEFVDFDRCVCVCVCVCVYVCVYARHMTSSWISMCVCVCVCVCVCSAHDEFVDFDRRKKRGTGTGAQKDAREEHMHVCGTLCRQIGLWQVLLQLPRDVAAIDIYDIYIYICIYICRH
jgi:hypothetical protein